MCRIILGENKDYLDWTLVGQDIGTDKGYVYWPLVDQDLGYITEVPLGGSFCVTVGLLGGEYLVLKYIRDIKKKG